MQPAAAAAAPHAASSAARFASISRSKAALHAMKDSVVTGVPSRSLPRRGGGEAWDEEGRCGWGRGGEAWVGEGKWGTLGVAPIPRMTTQ